MNTAIALRAAAGFPGIEANRPMSPHEHPYWRTLSGGFLVLLLVIIGAGQAVYRSARDSVAAAVSSNLQVIATLKATQLEAWLEEREHDIHGDLRAEFARPGLAESLLLWLRGGRRDAALQAHLLRELRIIAMANRFLEVSLRSPLDGSLLLASAGEQDTAAARAVALASARSVRTVLEDFHIQTSSGDLPRMHIGFMNTLHLGRNLQSAIVVDVALDASEVLFPMIQQWPGWNISAQVRLLRRNGDQVVVLNSLHRQSNGSLAPGLSTALADSVHASALRLGAGPLHGTGLRRQPVFAYALPVRHTPWTLVAEVADADAYAKLDTIAALTAAIVALLLLGSGWWLLQQNRNSEARVRHEAERKLLTTRINYLAKYANDCIVLCDGDGRVMEANDRCLATYGYSQEEFLGLTLADIHVPAKRGEVAHLLSQISADFGLIYEAEHLRRDGSHFDVEMSTSLIGVDGRPCYQAIIRDVSVRKRLQLEREEHLRHLNDLTCRLVNVQEEERRHLSGELHDQVGASLATLNLNLRRIGKLLPEPAPHRLQGILAETGSMLAETIARIRDYCAELRPAILDYSGLIPALEELVRRFGRYSDIAAAFRSENMEERLAPQVESMLFRIAQEALTNCAKHSNAGSVEVAIVRCAGGVAMTVTDDGAGFDPEHLGSKGIGLGLLTMRERAAMAGGTMTIESSPGRGTRIRVAVAAAQAGAAELSGL